ncbi:sigma-70 family RNA polymerase sigma factor [Zavarzinia sp. CC-PAN008]|uniref:sigma-70 family RNA polymerase sigma factor n=1 Tax=Zavarzinia sp. CC-PAN008 TaxID=3243332 RepID=UPI003F746C14
MTLATLTLDGHSGTRILRAAQGGRLPPRASNGARSKGLMTAPADQPDSNAGSGPDVRAQDPSADDLAGMRPPGPPVAVQPAAAIAAQHIACLQAVALSQDREAFETLFRHFAPRVKSYLLRQQGDATRAEELMQETMVLVWRKAHLFDPAKAAPATWIFRIARNLRIDAFRRERHPEIDPADPVLLPEPEPAGDTTLQRAQEAGMVSHALSSLSEAEQAVVRLSFYEDLSHSLIAERLGVPLGTVKSRLRLAFGKLRRILGEEARP